MGGLCGPGTRNTIYAQYDVHEKLGSGTFATVRRITLKTDPTTQKALKITSLKNLKKEEVEALQNEVKILGKISHSNVVKLWESFETEDKIYMVQDLLSGGELFDRIIQQTYFSEAEAAKCITQVTSALVYLHKQNIVHRDLKPENLLLTSNSDDYDVKIIDFGLAKCSPDPMVMPCGTPGYVAPEILKRKPYHKAVDIWSLGVIMYILLCGFPPFHEENGDLKKLYKQIRAGKYTFPPKFWKNISEQAKDLIRRMLTVRPNNRITAEGIMNDRWLEAAPTTGLSKAYYSNLRRHQAIDKLRRGVRVVLALRKIIDVFAYRKESAAGR